MLLEYIQAGLRLAKYEILSDEGSYYGEIPECRGVYANAKTLEDCREQLREVLEEWALLRVHRNLDLPILDGTELERHWLEEAERRLNEYRYGRVRGIPADELFRRVMDDIS